MPPRNLTSVSPHIGSNTNSSSDENLNMEDPFSQDTNEYESQSYDESSSFANSQSNLNANLKHTGSSTPEIKQHLLNYNSSFHNSSTSSLVNPFSSTNKLNSLYNDNSKASEYDRYPKRLSGSRVSSIHSSNSKTPSYLNKSNMDSDSFSNSSDRSSNPFLVDTDFSPFGGYPASSFPLLIDEKEDDDYLHNPDPIQDAEYEKHRIWYDFKSMDKRYSLALLGLLFFLFGGAALFVVLPIITFTNVSVHHNKPSTNSTTSYSSTGAVILSDYIYPKLSAIRTELIDPDTPDKYLSRKAKDGSYWKLVFSDEFAVDGRTFYDGDDQFWYAPDFHYDATKDLEWYDPDAVSTQNGTVRLRMDAFKNHDLYYRSGMLHSWNRMCFTQGIMEVSARLPNYGNITGLWPGLWSMGNLGRPGYMATTDGVWPYSYDACDAGITPNQSSPDGINYLPGQRLNSCTCEGDEHPNRGTGRGAPEIDIIEGEVDTNIRVGVASQSMQIAPMDIWYMPDYNWIVVHNNTITSMNTYAGGPFQQAVSATTTLNTTWYELGNTTGHFQKYSYEYLNDDEDGYLRWFVGDNPTFTVYANALAPNGNIGWRRISKEPMSMVMNLGISQNWAYIDFPSIKFPATFEIDYVRVYQPNDSVSITCDPDDYPTYDYIEAHPKAYNIWNYTLWNETGYTVPKNNLTGCS